MCCFSGIAGLADIRVISRSGSSCDSLSGPDFAFVVSKQSFARDFTHQMTVSWWVVDKVRFEPWRPVIMGAIQTPPLSKTSHLHQPSSALKSNDVKSNLVLRELKQDRFGLETYLEKSAVSTGLL